MRHWNNYQVDDGSVHCIGNGRIAAYEQGPNIIQIFGPPYSSPSFMQVLMCNDCNIETKTERETGTAIWRHEVYKAGAYIGEFTDFVDSELACIVRKISLMESIELEMKLEKDIKIIDNTQRFKQFDIKAGLLVYAEAGIYIYGKYPSPKQICHQLIVKGNIDLQLNEDLHRAVVKCNRGDSFMFIAGGPSYYECISTIESMLLCKLDDLLIRTRKWWLDFTKRRHDFNKIIPAHFTDRERLLKAIDDISVVIKTQQAIEGGVLAGHNYHLGYVRDQYGVCRCLLKLGYFEEARLIMKFYWDIWKRYGVIHNAQAMGVDGIFHIHENDDVEITGYLIILAFDYYESSRDEEFLIEILPMLEWAWEAQKRHLVSYMLSFNGDETYVAGGILPRTALNDGSAEATLLFITGGDKLLEWVGGKNIWEDERVTENLKLLCNTKTYYRENFWTDNRLATNNPKRSTFYKIPKFRPGVCQMCGSFEAWTECSNSGHYVCPECLSKPQLPGVLPETYYLQSVSLIPLYIGATLLTMEEIELLAEYIVKQYKATGRLPSRPDGNSSVGYDYGYLLYTLTELKHPLAEVIYDRMMLILDPTGAWVEYYMDDKPYNTRYRPWESGINLEAAINYAMNLA